MWSRTYSHVETGVSAAEIWAVWADVDHWSDWQDDVDDARLHGAFDTGSRFELKPKGGPRVKIEIVRCEAYRNFTDCTRFPFARMFGSHDIIERDGALELRTTIHVDGPLAMLWRRIVAQGVVDSLPEQSRALVRRARALRERREGSPA